MRTFDSQERGRNWTVGGKRGEPGAEGPIGPHPLRLNLNSALPASPPPLPEAKAEPSGSSGTAEPGDLRAVGVRSECWGGCPWVAPEPGCGIFIPSDEAKQLSLPRAISAQLICACFTMVLIKSPWSPGACVRSSHQKSKQRPGVADSLIM